MPNGKKPTGKDKKQSCEKQGKETQMKSKMRKKQGLVKIEIMTDNSANMTLENISPYDILKTIKILAKEALQVLESRKQND